MTNAAPDGSYAPAPDGEPDPGEVVWAWVPYEEDASRGKDRPVLVIGTRVADGQLLARCQKPRNSGCFRQGKTK